MVKVIILAESVLARKGIEQLVRGPGIEIVASATSLSAPDAALPTPDSVDLIIGTAEPAHLDDLLENLPEYLAEFDSSRDVPVVLLVELADPRIAARALRMGAHAVLPSNLPRARLLAALEAVSRNLVVTTPEQAGSIIAASPFGAAASGVEELVEALTTRERQVLGMLALGLANKEIASRLSLSEHTVKFHVAAILGKLGAASRTEAVAIGIRHGLILL